MVKHFDNSTHYIALVLNKKAIKCHDDKAVVGPGTRGGPESGFELRAIALEAGMPAKSRAHLLLLVSWSMEGQVFSSQSP